MLFRLTSRGSDAVHMFITHNFQALAVPRSRKLEAGSMKFLIIRLDIQVYGAVIAENNLYGASLYFLVHIFEQTCAGEYNNYCPSNYSA